MLQYFNTKVASAQSHSDQSDSTSLLLSLVGETYEKYFAEPISTLQVDPSCVEPIIASLNKQQLNTTVFDALHDAVCNDAASHIVIGDLINFSVLINMMSMLLKNKCLQKCCCKAKVVWRGGIQFYSPTSTFQKIE